MFRFCLRGYFFIFLFFRKRVKKRGEVNSAWESGISHNPVKWPNTVISLNSIWCKSNCAACLHQTTQHYKTPNRLPAHRPYSRVNNAEWCSGQSHMHTAHRAQDMIGAVQKTSESSLTSSQPKANLWHTNWVPQLKLLSAVRREIQQDWILGQ